MNELGQTTDSFWQLIAGVLVLLMQAGFLLLEAGRVRERNAVSVAQKNVTDLAICWAVFMLVGYSAGFGIDSPLFSDSNSLADIAEFVFQLGFCGAAATIVSGAVAERCRFESYILITVLIAALFYPLSVWLVWGAMMVPDRLAPLADLGFQDFAGGTVVHALSGAIGLAAAMVLGPRIGRIGKDGTVNELPGYSPVLQLLGTLLLIFGWIGFNGGSLSLRDPALSIAIVNTLTAASFGALTAMSFGYFLDKGIFNPCRSINGLLAGLVAITASAPYATVSQTVFLAIFVVLVVQFVADWLPRKLRVDDPLDVFATHGVAGFLGSLALTWFLPSSMLISASRLDQFGVQLMGSAGIMCLGFVGAYCILRAVNNVVPIRVDENSERLGLNYTEHGVRLDGELLQQSISTTIADAGGFASELEVFEQNHFDQSEIAQALEVLLRKHHQARQTITRQSERFQQFAATTNDVLWETDARCQFTLLQINYGSAEVCDIEALHGKIFFECFEMDEITYRDTMQKMLANEKLESIEVKLHVSHSQSYMNLRLSGVAYFDDQGQFQGYRGGASDITEQKLAEERSLFLASHDPLTGFQSRLSIKPALQAWPKNRKATLMVMDLDNFKQINDDFGYHAGDLFLASISQTLGFMLQDGDQAFRKGGDEFVLIIARGDGVEAPQQAKAWCDLLSQRLQEPFIIDGQEVQTSFSIGVSFYPEHGHDLEELLHKTDIAQHCAKEQGNNRLVIYDESMGNLARQQRDLRADLLEAFNRQEFFLVYQPKVDNRCKKLLGFEALLRWRHPQRGVLGPEYFLDTIEKMQRMNELGEWVLEQACRFAAQWQSSDLYVAVNVAPSQLKDVNLVSKIDAVLKKTGLPPQCLELELIEKSLLAGFRETRGVLNALNKLGLCIAIDDFGCGSTSLQYLHRLPVAKLKIDKSFITSIAYSKSAREITRSILHLSKELGLSVTAEGVEQESQLQLLCQWDCDEIQGYYISKAVSEQLAMEWIKADAEQRPLLHMIEAEANSDRPGLQ